MDQAELNRLCQLPGREGALWRLLRAWDPDKLLVWMAEERRRGASPDDIIHCVATAMSGAAFNVARNLGGDRRGAMLGGQGLVEQLRIMVAHQLEHVGGVHQVRTPLPGLGGKRIIQ